MDGSSVGTNRTRMRYQSVLVKHGCDISGTLTVHRLVICVLSLGFMWVLADYRSVLSVDLHSMDGLSINTNRTLISYQWTLAEHGWFVSGH